MHFVRVKSAFLAVILMVYTFRILLGLLESDIVKQTSMCEINVTQPNFASRAISIINFEIRFLNFYADTMRAFLEWEFLSDCVFS